MSAHALTHAGCGGSLKTDAGCIVCETCGSTISDAREIAAREPVKPQTSTLLASRVDRLNWQT